MAESSDQTALQRRATWVGLRTLRQRPKVVGETRSGDPVFEVRSVRLVLHDEAAHFSRLIQCSKCDREVPGAPVMGPADLDRPAHSVICKDCVRASVAASPLQPERRTAKAEPTTPPLPPPATEGSAPEGPHPVGDVRLAAVEAQLEAVVSRLAELADLGGDESAESRLHDALLRGLAEIRAEVMAASEGGAARASPTEGHALENADVLAQVVRAQQGQLAALSAALDDIRAAMERQAESNQAQARTQAEVDRRLDEGVEKARAEVIALEQRLGAGVTTLTDQVQALRADLEASLGAPVRTGLPMVVQAIQELARARDAVTGNIEGLVGKARDAEARMEALASAIEEGSDRLRAVELRMENSIDRLTAALETHRRELTVAGAAGTRLDTGVGHTATGASTPGELLDGLERQLQEAEGRLAQLTATPAQGGAGSADAK